MLGLGLSTLMDIMAVVVLSGRFVGVIDVSESDKLLESLDITWANVTFNSVI